jgi:CRISPR-associated protein Cmr2
VVVAESLLLISLGPVQGFIAAGRRGQDLWAGSQLLSDLSRSVAESLEGRPGTTLIFPGGLGSRAVGADPDDRPSVANKILAVVATEAVATAAEAAIKAAEDHLEARFNDLFRVRTATSQSDFDKELHVARAKKQILGDPKQNNGMFEVFWVALPLAERTYGETREHLERLLAARKNTRSWGPVTWGERVPKSPIDGERETVVKEHVFDRYRRADEFGSEANQQAALESLRKRLGIEPEETLDGPGMLKRLWQVRNRSDSEEGDAPPKIHGTAHMAASPVLQRIERIGDRAHEAVQSYLEALKAERVDVRRELKIRVQPADGTFTARIRPEWGGEPSHEAPMEVPRAFALKADVGHDGIFLFEGRLASLANLDEGPARDAFLERAGAALRMCLRALGLSSEGPTPYYALLQADGDSMGKALDHLADWGIKEHRRFSDTLEADFAQKCRAQIARHGGSLIYAGGDDVLALLPLHTLLDAIDDLRALFATAIDRSLPKDFPKRPDVTRPTLSVGVAICHHLDPMSNARELARRAEVLAKDSGRNRLALVMDKRSGSTISICDAFDGEANTFTRRLRTWIHLLDRGHLPDGVAFELEELVRPFELRSPGTHPAAGDRNAAIRALVERTLSRKQPKDQPALGEQVRTAMAGVLGGETGPKPDALQATLQLRREIQVARLLLRALTDARAPKQGDQPT